MAIFRAVRSAASFLAMILVFGVLGGLYQRVVLGPASRLWPARRDALMWSFMVRMGAWVLAILRVGGASFRRRGTVPAGVGARLVLMNHQSVLDIPTVFQITYPEIPMIVTRTRYRRHVPLVSLMLKILDYPLVDPDHDPRGAISTLKDAVHRQEHGLLIFPEGHRSRDGSVGPFETGGLRVVLGARRMPVYLIVTDGFWVSRRLFDFVFRVHEIRGETDVLGPFLPPEAISDLPAFIEGLRTMMITHLDAMRRRGPGMPQSPQQEPR
jgi:1-acyl-sn-glycerol-3-phosphate acyltransferase